MAHGDPPPADAPEPDGSPAAGPPADALVRWAADARVDEAARARRRTRGLAEQAGTGTTLEGVLTDLGERGAPVRLITRHGHVLDGRVTAMGLDHVVVTDRRQGRVLVPLEAVAAIRDRSPGESGVPAAPSSPGDRSGPSVSSFVGALADLAGDRPRVRVVLASDEVRGDLRAVSDEVLVVEITTLAREQVHIAVSAIDHLIIA